MIQSGVNQTIRDKNPGQRWESMTAYERETVSRAVLRHLNDAPGRLTDKQVGEALFDGDAIAARVVINDLQDQRRVVNVTEAGDTETHWIATESPAP